MSEQQLNIKLSIASKTYDFTIDKDLEEIYRLAARELNDRISETRKDYIDGASLQDYLAFAALYLMVDYLRLERRNGVDDGDVKTLTELANRLSKHLEK